MTISSVTLKIFSSGELPEKEQMLKWPVKRVHFSGRYSDFFLFVCFLSGRVILVAQALFGAYSKFLLVVFKLLSCVRY